MSVLPIEPKSSPVVNDLIFDIGVHCGDDTAYYLDLGYRVLGVDANPLLTAHCARRFDSEISQGRLTVLNVGVLETPGSFQFFRNLTHDDWSSFDEARSNRPGDWEQIEVECLTTLQLIEKYGKPFFMKVDIEGADMQTLLSLSPHSAPPYVSLELSCEEAMIEKLIDLGYTAFKFVDGDSYRTVPEIFEHEIGWRMLRKTGRILPLAKTLIGNLIPEGAGRSEWNPPGKHSPDGYTFTAHSSGPFGEKAAGKWMEKDAAIRWFNKLKKLYRRAGQEDSLWWDVHARHSTVNR